MPPYPTPDDLPIKRCEQWPTMLVMPRRVMDLATTLASRAVAHSGRSIYLHDVISALIMLRAPAEPAALRQMIMDYVASRELGASPLTLPRHQYMVRLPAPTSHRLDELVARARAVDGQPFRRRDVVGALILLHAPREGLPLNELYDTYLSLRARDAALRGQTAAAVLSRKRPRPGVRRLEPA